MLGIARRVPRRQAPIRLPSFAGVARSGYHLRRIAKPIAFGLFALLWLALLELVAPVVAIAAAPIFYWRLLVTNPADAATLAPGDATELHYPLRRWVAEQVARSEAPLWNPFVAGGHSAIGDVQF